MLNSATKASWETREPPRARQALGYEHLFDATEMDRLRGGLIPEAMEDKWFAYFENGWLYLHRSWSGALIYWLRLESDSAGAFVAESWVNRDADQHPETDIAYDRSLLHFLLHGLILGQAVAFPIRRNDAATTPAGLYQHHLIGRARPEIIVPDGRN